MQMTIHISKFVVKLLGFILVLLTLAAVGRAGELGFCPGCDPKAEQGMDVVAPLSSNR